MGAALPVSLLKIPGETEHLAFERGQRAVELQLERASTIGARSQFRHWLALSLPAGRG